MLPCSRRQGLCLVTSVVLAQWYRAWHIEGPRVNKWMNVGGNGPSALSLPQMFDCSQCLLTAVSKASSEAWFSLNSVHRGTLSPLHSSQPWRLWTLHWATFDILRSCGSAWYQWGARRPISRPICPTHAFFWNLCINMGVSHISWVVQMPVGHFLFYASGLWTHSLFGFYFMI